MDGSRVPFAYFGIKKEYYDLQQVCNMTVSALGRDTQMQELSELSPSLLYGAHIHARNTQECRYHTGVR